MDVELRGEGYKSETHLERAAASQESTLGDAESPLAPTVDIYWCFLRPSPDVHLAIWREYGTVHCWGNRGRRSMHVAMQALEGQRHSLDRVCLMGEIALGRHQDTTGSFGVELGGRMCGLDSTSLGDSREGCVTWGQSRSCLWKQHVARKKTEGKYQELVPWQHSRTQRRANYRWQFMARCCYRIAEQSYDVCIYLSVHLRLCIWHILNPCSVKWCWKVWSDERHYKAYVFENKHWPY